MATDFTFVGAAPFTVPAGTADFSFGTPATDPHFDQVVLLLHADGTDGSTTFTDSSSSPRTITRVGALPTISTTQSKFGGASARFGGGASLRIAASSGVTFPTEDFTIEGWIFPSQVASFQNILKKSTGGGLYQWVIELGGGKLNMAAFTSAGGIAADIVGTTTVTPNAWHHFAVTRAGSAFKLFLDGVLQGTSTFSGSLRTNDEAIGIGAAEDGSSALFGVSYLDDIRITKGVARYTATFTPPTEEFPGGSGTVAQGDGAAAGTSTAVAVPDTSQGVASSIGAGAALGESDALLPDEHWTNVILLTHLNGANGSTSVTDSSPAARTVTVLDGALSTATPKFGSAALAGSYVVAGELFAGSFTAECWARWDADDPAVSLISFELAVTFDVWQVVAEGTMLSLTFSDSGGSTNHITGAVPVDNVYHHIAWVRNGSTHTLYVDGVALGTHTNGSALDVDAIYVNNGWTANHTDEVRITNSVARYTATFTPPTEEFPGGSGTVAQGDGAAAGTSTAVAVPDTSQGVASSIGAGAATGLATALQQGDGAAVGSGVAAGQFIDANQVGGWDTADTSPTTDWTFSSQGRVGTVTAQIPPGGFGRAAATRGLTTKSSGRWYFEVSFNYVSGPSSATYYAGIVQTSRTTADIANGQMGALIWNDSSGADVTFGFAFDADARQVWIRTPTTWLLGDPGISGDPITDQLPVGGNYQPFARVSTSVANVRRTMTARFTADTMVYGVPAGFAALEDVPGEGAAVAAGVGVAAAQGQALSSTADAAAAGTSTLDAQGLAARVGEAAASGTSTALAQSLNGALGAAAAPGTGAALAQARSIATATGAAAGSADVTSMAVLEGLASAAGEATLAGVGATRVLFLTGLHVLELRPATTARQADTPLTARTEEVSTI